MRRRLRALLGRSFRAVHYPSLARLDAMEASLDTRLDSVIRRVDELAAMIQSADGRAAVASERSAAQAETNSRLARRLEEIERLLAAPAATGERV